VSQYQKKHSTCHLLTFLVLEKITEADAPTIWLDATPYGLLVPSSSYHPHHLQYHCHFTQLCRKFCWSCIFSLSLGALWRSVSEPPVATLLSFPYAAGFYLYECHFICGDAQIRRTYSIRSYKTLGITVYERYCVYIGDSTIITRCMLHGR